MPEPLKGLPRYTRSDVDGVGRIYQPLKERGFKPWLDREEPLRR